MKLRKNILFLATLLLGQFAAAEVPTIADGRCGTWGDSLAQGKPTADRVAFAMSCEKDAERLANIEYSFKEGLSTAGDTSKRAGYPTYGAFDPETRKYVNPQQWFAPPTTSGGCESIPQGFKIIFFCVSGCYTGDQGVLFSDGTENIHRAYKADLKSVRTLSSTATMDHLDSKDNASRVVTDIVPGMQHIRTFVMKSGGILRVTMNHPLVDSRGQVRPASSFKRGEALVKVASGMELGAPEFDPIVDFTDQDIVTSVYNVKVNSSDPREQIVVAQGYLNGAIYYQNEGVKDLNRVWLRTALTSDLIQK